ncbi:hypothetical protein FQN60_014861 [Etheostoma spectabile]|uniref:Uncharacterized protein n=1 Tax=Etheostoma spectabile TaxID=54343 RepID=A0A5J5CSB1_9PERO|nr:hypothetical protein FQN60_014861 [Etheostoma spectabile]
MYHFKQPEASTSSNPVSVCADSQRSGTSQLWKLVSMETRVGRRVMMVLAEQQSRINHNADRRQGEEEYKMHCKVPCCACLTQLLFNRQKYHQQKVLFKVEGLQPDNKSSETAKRVTTCSKNLKLQHSDTGLTGEIRQPLDIAMSARQDWRLKVNLWRQLKLPENIAVTTLRPDIVLVSEITRQVVLLVLTFPWEDRMEEAFERRRAKDEELAGES